jgi:hypothetical protein
MLIEKQILNRRPALRTKDIFNMTVPVTENQPQTEQKQNDKELNFRKLEEKYQRELMQERQGRLEAEAKLKSVPVAQEEDEDDEPYVDKKKLHKTLARFGEQTKQTTQSEIQKAVQTAIHEERKQNWVKQNGDFYDVLQHAEKLAQLDPELAESILEMPEGFERQKLVYKNIKALGLHKPAVPEKTIQDKVDANRRSPYYQPSGIGAAPYASVGDFSKQGQKQAYDKMVQLRDNLRLG